VKKTLLVVAVAAVVLGVAGWTYAHGPGFGYGPGPGFYRMGPGMMGPGMMGPGMMGPWMHGPQHMEGAGYGPCWQATELTPEQKKQYEEQAKAAVEQYIQQFLPEYKLEKKTE
jgi:hypothetical protein